MSKKTDGKPRQDKPFFRPFEALAKERLAALQKEKEKDPKGAAKGKPDARPTPTPSPVAAGPEPESFADLLFGVKPMGREARPNRPAPAASSEPALADDPDAAAVRAHLQALVNGGEARFEIHDDGQRIEGRRLDVDPRIVRRLRRGEFVVDLRCDLHGLTAHEARAKLEDVLPRARQRGERVLLVIHGKGHNSPGGRSVLRGEMAAWLSQGTASASVAAFTTALDDDGGEGALYVLLRRV